MKTCTHCGAEKSEAEFPRRTEKSRITTGTWCKACHREYGKKHSQRLVQAFAAGVFSPEWIAKGESRCTRCGELKALASFYASRGNPHSYCKPCFNEYERRRVQGKPGYREHLNAYQNKRRKLMVIEIGKIKSEKGCAKCGERHPACLEFHHLDPSVKEFNMAEVSTRVPRAKMLAEIEKCIVLCSNCHRKHHYEVRNGAG